MSNPVLNLRAFSSQPSALAAECMTLQGTINKSFLLLVVLMLGALFPWAVAMGGNALVAADSIMLGNVGGLVLVFIIAFKPRLAQYLAIPYAALEGAAVGGIAGIMELEYPGIAINAVALSAAALVILLLAYRTRLVRVTDRFRAVAVAGTGAIALLLLVYWGLSLLHLPLPFMPSDDDGMGGIILSIFISLVVLGFAAVNLVLDFDMIESQVSAGAPRYMEWYAGFALLVTLVWLYLEMLRLLSRLRILLRLLPP
jgi:uncharacterized YccA/Bax inhibitor family protein